MSILKENEKSSRIKHSTTIANNPNSFIIASEQKFKLSNNRYKILNSLKPKAKKVLLQKPSLTGNLKLDKGWLKLERKW